MGTNTTVLMLSENYYPLSTASAQRAFAYAKMLASHSHKTVVITKSPISSKSNNITVVSVGAKTQIPIFDPVLLFLYCLKSVGIIWRHKVDLIFTTVPKINNAIAGFILSRLFGIPLIIDIRDYWESSLFSYPLNAIIPKQLAFLIVKTASFLYRNSSSIITVNKTLRNLLLKRGVSPKGIYVIPNGADTSLFGPCEDEKCVEEIRSKYKLPLSKLIFIYAGGLSLDYNFDAILKAVSRLPENKDLVLLIVGNPTLLMTNKKILKIVKKLGLEKVVKVLGPLPVDELAELLKCCDVGVIPLKSTKLLKHVITAKVFAYAASGLPVLASGPKGGELEKFVQGNDIGLFIGNATPQNFKYGFNMFLKAKKNMRKTGMKGREIIERYYDRYVLANKIIDVINNLMHHQKK